MTCEVGKYINGIICSDCDLTKCVTCELSPTQCLTCQINEYLDSGTKQCLGIIAYNKQTIHVLNQFKF